MNLCSPSHLGHGLSCIPNVLGALRNTSHLRQLDEEKLSAFHQSYAGFLAP